MSDWLSRAIEEDERQQDGDLSECECTCGECAIQGHPAQGHGDWCYECEV